MSAAPVVLRRFGWQPQPYRPVWQAMQRFTAERGSEDPDALWLLNHAPVFTQGRNGRAEHVLAPGDIEVVPIDRGGQVTYHGPGQLMAYVMLDLKRLGIGIRSLVTALENAMIATLAGYDIEAYAKRDAPGVYVGAAKIGSIGLRVSRSNSYHGLALNVDMDLEPFSRIDPCGYHGLAMTQIADLGGPSDLDRVADDLGAQLCTELGLARIDSSDTRADLIGWRASESQSRP
ncbi:lipoyl(octanoyl) transferase LipB [Salinisphaera hydrothermalis]|uniref:Octanoyltransferase n=1 Tax=Salinisphaera hydrothermalis (strain C41B8) TaxID=1304275 RepID=A0A084IL32_SALHC|nr:lipoyl(octanoyl) transferase LipB [Salinisphaera hydrothermalis]KEZ77416.1 lipoyltransferase [Salinisphaera hydrothermalis C41B8]